MTRISLPEFKDFVLKSWMLKSWRNQDVGGAISIRHCPDFGVIIERRVGFWASNDTRWDLVGNSENTACVQPTVGPFQTAREAFDRYILLHQTNEKLL